MSWSAAKRAWRTTEHVASPGAAAKFSGRPPCRRAQRGAGTSPWRATCGPSAHMSGVLPLTSTTTPRMSVGTNPTHPVAPLPPTPHVTVTRLLLWDDCFIRLKHTATPQTPAVGSGGPYPPELRAAPRKFWPWAVALDVWPWSMPEAASWTSGVLLPKGTLVQPQRPSINSMFCSRHPPCPSQEVAAWPPPRH